jgi:hypothetical protein
MSDVVSHNGRYGCTVQIWQYKAAQSDLHSQQKLLHMNPQIVPANDRIHRHQHRSVLIVITTGTRHTKQDRRTDDALAPGVWHQRQHVTNSLATAWKTPCKLHQHTAALGASKSHTASI